VIETRIPLGRGLLAAGLLGALMTLFVAQLALSGLAQVHRSNQAVTRIISAERDQQDADMMHDALRADVFRALLVGRGVRSQSTPGVDAETSGHVATMLVDLHKIALLNVAAPAGRSLRDLDAPLRSYSANALRLARTALTDPAQAEIALPAFEASFYRLVSAQAVATAELSLEAEQTKNHAERTASSVHQRILLSATLALAILLVLTYLLHRMGKSLAQLMKHQRGVAETLQQSLLPDRLPALPGTQLAARYLPSGSGVDVGGDWYDVIALPGGDVGLVMGDVVGHDLRAAAVMGQVRNALRAYALEGLSPAAVMERLNDFVRQVDPDEMATCVFAVFSPAVSTLLVSNAGHYPPLLIDPDGRSAFLEQAPCAPIGGLEAGTYSETLYHVVPESIVLFFTDGLIERRGEAIEVGLERLQRIAESGPRDLSDLCDHVLAKFFAGAAPTDDVAVLALSTQARLGPSLSLTVDADPNALASLRRTIFRWLEEASANPIEAFELTVACCEAASNAMEHAYGPDVATFQVEAVLRDREVEICVTDQGSWRPPRGDDRGRGLLVIKAFTDAVIVDRAAQGTTVTLRRRLASQRRGA
jgi:serine phosphatase RsbU (regulator of sigma subunit)/anti-sigma regulatory factor (Ser/Thr protein kinase)